MHPRGMIERTRRSARLNSRDGSQPGQMRIDRRVRSTLIEDGLGPCSEAISEGRLAGSVDRIPRDLKVVHPLCRKRDSLLVEFRQRDYAAPEQLPQALLVEIRQRLRLGPTAPRQASLASQHSTEAAEAAEGRDRGSTRLIGGHVVPRAAASLRSDGS
jgi:hypothetical protein